MGETSSKINIAGVVRNIRSRSNIYTPIIEAIVNAVDSIRSTNRSDGKVTVKLIREQMLDTGDIAGIKEV